MYGGVGEPSESGNAEPLRLGTKCNPLLEPRHGSFDNSFDYSISGLPLYDELARVHSEFGNDVFQLLNRQAGKLCPKRVLDRWFQYEVRRCNASGVAGRTREMTSSSQLNTDARVSADTCRSPYF